MIRKQFIVFIFAILAILYSGCGEEQSTNEDLYPINIILAPRTQEGNSPEIDKIWIVVEGDDIKTIVKEYPIEAGTSEFSGAIDIPIGKNRKITVEAWAKKELIYKGNKTITGQEMIDIPTKPIEVMLDPVEKAVVKLSPLRIEVKSGDSFMIDVVVKNFPNLFGVTLRLMEFDETYIKPVEVDVIGTNKLLGDNVLYIDNIDQNSREPGTLSIGITRTGEGTVGSEGIIASVKFEAVAAGETTIKIDYDNLVWTESGEFPPPKEAKQEEIEALKVYSDRGETTVIVN